MIDAIKNLDLRNIPDVTTVTRPAIRQVIEQRVEFSDEQLTTAMREYLEKRGVTLTQGESTIYRMDRFLTAIGQQPYTSLIVRSIPE